MLLLLNGAVTTATTITRVSSFHRISLELAVCEVDTCDGKHASFQDWFGTVAPA
jgi:hypothetical protein